MIDTLMSKVITFFGLNTKYAIFSNFAPSKFVLDGHTFYSSEQAFMYYKAITFNDNTMAEKILNYIDENVYTEARKEFVANNRASPAVKQWKKHMMAVKKMGRNVSNFVVSTWAIESVRIMGDCIIQKFIQDRYAQRLLLETGDALICEASPRDKIWGVGVGSAIAQKGPEFWKGKNQLGNILTCARTALL